jgi:hypothetical protein
VRYDPKSGHTLYLAPSVVSFDASAPTWDGTTTVKPLTTPTMPEPVAPAIEKTGLKVKIAPDLYIHVPPLGSNELKRLQDTWPLYWFNDRP